MERIQEALEKARREREGKSSPPNVPEGKSGIPAGTDDLLEEATTQAAEPEVAVPASDDTLLGMTAEEVGESETAGENPRMSAQTGASSIRVRYSQTRTITIEEAELKDRRIVAGFAHDPRSEPYRQLRGQILKKFRENNWQTLAITSPKTGSGRTLTAINLAISLSLEANQTVLLVDLDLRNPGVAQTLGVKEVDGGIVEYLRGEKELKDILVNPGFERLVILPGTPQGAFTSEILSSPEMQAVIEELIARYPSRLIVFDLPAVLDHDDALVFAPKCDATLMILEEGGSKQADIERAYQLLDGANIIGSVFNKVRYT